MRGSSLVLVLCFFLFSSGVWPGGWGGCWASEEKNPSDLIDVKKYDFSILLDIRYATIQNFTKQKIYPEARCVLRRSVAEALQRVQAAVKMQSLGLKVYDCYRPQSLQKKFWEMMPVKRHGERYVADPKNGSKHTRGAAVDLTLVDPLGQELEMPTPYDTFSSKSHRDYKGGTRISLKNRLLLEQAMVKEGFLGLATEWWHFDYKGWEQFPLEDVALSSIP